MSNLISATFSEEDEKEVMELLAQLKAKFPFGIKLTDDQKKRLPKLDDARIPFADKGLFYGEQQPLIVPPYTNSTVQPKVLPNKAYPAPKLLWTKWASCLMGRERCLQPPKLKLSKTSLVRR